MMKYRQLGHSSLNVSELTLVDKLKAADISSSEAVMARLDQVSALKPEYPGYLPVWRRGDKLFSQLHG